MEHQDYKARILVADDELGVRTMLKDFFTEKNFKVSTAAGGREAIQKMLSFHPHILLLDMKMPDISGEEVLKYIYENKIEIGVIIITGFPELIANKTLLDGVYDCLVKPFDFKYLKNTVLTTVVMACKKNGVL
ncbi:MAG: response regulator [Candidatus Omnitrophota bacterium]|nr:response regulator [Candidatus Omnitrophota bacterium]